jgi:hypothetical protein
MIPYHRGGFTGIPIRFLNIRAASQGARVLLLTASGLSTDARFAGNGPETAQGRSGMLESKRLIN